MESKCSPLQLSYSLRDLGIATEVQCITHVGNEWADEEAKKATGWGSRMVSGKLTEEDTNDHSPAIGHSNKSGFRQ